MGLHFRLLLASFIHKVFLQFGILSIVYTVHILLLHVCIWLESIFPGRVHKPLDESSSIKLEGSTGVSLVIAFSLCQHDHLGVSHS